MPILNIFARDSAFSYGMKLNMDNATGRPHTPFLGFRGGRGVGGWNLHIQPLIFQNTPLPLYIFPIKLALLFYTEHPPARSPSVFYPPYITLCYIDCVEEVHCVTELAYG